MCRSLHRAHVQELAWYGRVKNKVGMEESSREYKQKIGRIYVPGEGVLREMHSTFLIVLYLLGSRCGILP